MSATESKGQGGTIGIVIVLIALVGLGVGAALFFSQGRGKKAARPETPKKEEVVTPMTKLVEAPPPLPEMPPTVEEIPDDPVPEPEPETSASSKIKKKAIPIGTIDVKAAQAVTKQNYAKIRGCYEKQLKVNHLLQGNVKVKITIFPDGTVNSVKFIQDTMRNSPMNDCIKSEIMTWKFPKPEGGKVEINQSYRLEPKAG
jgi:type IV secretory pathway VirB10-like protein